MTILIYHSGALGDFITTLPLLRLLRRHHPNASLVFLGRRAHGDLGRAAGYFSETWDLDSAGYAALFADTPGRLPPELERIDAAVAFAADNSPVVRALESLNLRFFLHHPPLPPRRMHVVDYHLTLLDGTALGEDDRVPRLRVAGETVPHNALVLLHPGSGSAAKNWPRARFEMLAKWLESRGMTSLWLLGPVEEESGVVLPEQSAVVRSPDLGRLVTLLAGCALYVGNDSGVTHLAAAAGCPTVALFGPTDPAVWAPRGRRVTVVQSPSGTMDGIGEEDVMKVCAAMVCQPPKTAGRSNSI